MASLGRSISNFIKDFRHINDITQEKLAAKLGYSRATMNRWEGDGAGSATLDDVEKMARAFKVSEAKLLGIAAPTQETLRPAATGLEAHSILIARIVLALPSLNNGDLEHLASLAEGFAESAGRSQADKLGDNPS